MNDRRNKANAIKDGVVDAIPIKTVKIGEDTHLTIKVSLLIRLITLVFFVMGALYTVKGRLDSLEAADVNQVEALATSDLQLRKDLNVIATALSLEVENSNTSISLASETGLREANTALENTNSALVAEIEANRETLQLELENLMRLIISANKTTHAELKPMIDKVQNTMDLKTDAMLQRVNSIEARLQDEVKQAFWRKGKKQ